MRTTSPQPQIIKESEKMELYDVKNRPMLIQYEITNRAKKLENDLYVLSKGNNFDFDLATRQALQSLCTAINFYVLDKRG